MSASYLISLQSMVCPKWWVQMAVDGTVASGGDGASGGRSHWGSHGQGQHSLTKVNPSFQKGKKKRAIHTGMSTYLS